MATYTRFRNIPQLTDYGGASQTDVSLSYLEQYLQSLLDDGMDLNPDFQRGHVWTEEQQIRFVEFQLRGGVSGRLIFLNCSNWHKVAKPKDFVLVDGLQRITANLRFLRNEIPAFGTYYKDFEDRLPAMTGPSLRFVINDLPTRAAVLQWYLELNDGGTPHSQEELDRVRALLKAEQTS